VPNVLEAQANRQSAGSGDQRFTEAVNPDPANLLCENEINETMIDSVPEPAVYFD